MEQQTGQKAASSPPHITPAPSPYKAGRDGGASTPLQSRRNNWLRLRERDKDGIFICYFHFTQHLHHGLEYIFRLYNLFDLFTVVYNWISLAHNQPGFMLDYYHFPYIIQEYLSNCLDFCSFL